jgi:hypothetical protein
MCKTIKQKVSFKAPPKERIAFVEQGWRKYNWDPI